jgi:hypothetical protein
LGSALSLDATHTEPSLLSKLSNQDEREDLSPAIKSNGTSTFSVADVTNNYDASIKFESTESIEPIGIIMSLKPTKPVMDDLTQLLTTE